MLRVWNRMFVPATWLELYPAIALLREWTRLGLGVLTFALPLLLVVRTRSQGRPEFLTPDDLAGVDLSGLDLIVAVYFDVQGRVNFSQTLNQVVGERVVVVDD